MDQVSLVVGMWYRGDRGVLLDPKLSFDSLGEESLSRLATISGEISSDNGSMSTEEKFSTGLRELVQEKLGSVIAEMFEASTASFQLLEEQIVSQGRTRIYGITTSVNVREFRMRMKPRPTLKEFAAVNDPLEIQTPPFNTDEIEKSLEVMRKAFQVLFSKDSSDSSFTRPTLSKTKYSPKKVVQPIQSKRLPERKTTEASKSPRPKAADSSLQSASTPTAPQQYDLARSVLEGIRRTLHQKHPNSSIKVELTRFHQEIRIGACNTNISGTEGTHYFRVDRDKITLLSAFRFDQILEENRSLWGKYTAGQ